MKNLSVEEIQGILETLPGWTQEANKISKQYVFADFLEALAFIQRVGQAAEAANHHPDIYNSYNKVTITLSTHDTGGVTEKDIELARSIEIL